VDNNSSSYINTSSPSPKPHNYFNELSPGQQEEYRWLDAMIAKAERYRKISEAVNMFESFQRWLKITRPKHKCKRRPSIEQVAIARGIIKIRSPKPGLELELELEEAGH
jgi:hypothetical protein